MVDLNYLQKKIKRFKFFKIIIWISNILFILLSFFQYYNNNMKLIIDKYFIVLTILNTFTFYLTYLITDRLSFFKYKFKHFNNLQNK